MIKFPVKLPVLPIHNLDITNWDLTRLDPRPLLNRADLPGAVLDSPVTRTARRAVHQARDVAVTAVGFGVLASQKVQVRRREVFDALAARRQRPAQAPADAPAAPPSTPTQTANA